MEWYSFLARNKINAVLDGGNDKGMTILSIQEPKNWVIYSRIKVIWKKYNQLCGYSAFC